MKLAFAIEETIQRQTAPRNLATTLEKTQLIQESIEHWERMHNNPHCGETPYSGGCPLCQRFLAGGARDEPKEIADVQCSLCPVAEAARASHCVGTPWSEAERDWVKLKATVQGPSQTYKERLHNWQVTSRKMIEFLGEVGKKLILSQ